MRIKKCQCGGKATLTQSRSTGRFLIYCTIANCNRQTNWQPTREIVTEQWNCANPPRDPRDGEKDL